MPSLVDHVADVASGGVELRRLSKLYDFPDFVRTANLQENLEKRAMDVPYADIPRKQFPVDTKASTWLSCLFYQEKQAEFHPKDRQLIERRLNQFVDYWKIKTAVDAMKARWTELHKTAEEQLPDSAYAYVWVAENGQKIRSYPLRSAMEVKAAGEWLQDNRDRIPFEMRHTMAKKILEKAASFGAALGDTAEFLEKQAGRGMCSPSEVVDAIRTRAYLIPESVGVVRDDDGQVKDAGLRARFLKMAETVRTLPKAALQSDMLVKLANTLDQCDRANGLVREYAKGLPRPEDVIFKISFSKAASLLHNHVALTSGKVYEKEAFARIKLADVQTVFGDDFANAVKTAFGEVDPEKLAEQAAALPRPEAELFDSLLAENSIYPTMAKAASARMGLSHKQLAALAAEYR